MFESRGGPSGTRIGFPVNPLRRFDDGGRLQRFERGIIAGPASRGVFIVRRQIEERHRASGGVEGPWGYPVTHTTAIAGTDGLVCRFQTRTAFYSPATGAHWLNGPILSRYREEGGAAGHLGFPITDVEQAPNGTHSATFERGVITYDPDTGEVDVVPGPP